LRQQATTPYGVKKGLTNLSVLFSNFVKLLSTYLLAYADDVNILGGSAHTVKENAEALAVAARRLD